LELAVVGNELCATAMTIHAIATHPQALGFGQIKSRHQKLQGHPDVCAAG
jgi:hypothetical protein